MVRKNIGQQELLDAVIQYESDVRLTNFVGETEVKFIYRFKAQRRDETQKIEPKYFSKSGSQNGNRRNDTR